jgi:hypothetical protein
VVAERQRAQHVNTIESSHKNKARCHNNKAVGSKTNGFNSKARGYNNKAMGCIKNNNSCRARACNNKARGYKAI